MAKKQPQASDSEASKRDAKGRFGAGNSGNPGGVPQSIRDIQKALADDCLPKAKALLANLLGDEAADMDHRLKAADIAFKYTLPKPQASVKVEGLESPFAGLTPAQLLAIAKK